MKKRFEACVQAVHFLLRHFGEMDKLKIVKLIYFADKRHLFPGGRTITDDCYVAMRHGPVGSMVLNVLNRNTEYLEPEQLEFIDRYIRQVEVGNDDYKCANDEMEYSQLSESDKTCLIKVGEKFRHTDKWDLVNLTHQYPEWTQFEAELNQDPSISKPIPIVNFFSCIKDDPFGFTPEDVKISRAFYLGMEEQLDNQDEPAA